MRASLLVVLLTLAGLSDGLAVPGPSSGQGPGSKAFLLPGGELPKGTLLQLPGQTVEPPTQPPPDAPFGGPPAVLPVPQVSPLFTPPTGGLPLIPPAPGVPAVTPPCCPVPAVPACPADPPPPVVTLKMRVLACTPANQQILYKICIENNSPAPAHHVLVRDPLPPNAKFVTAIPKPTEIGPELIWAFGTLPCGCRKEITLILEPLCDGDIKNCARVQFEHGQCVITHVGKSIGFPTMPYIEKPPGGPPAPGGPPPGKKLPVVTTGKLELAVTGPESAAINSDVIYTVTLRNAGDGLAEVAMITCDLPKSVEFVGAGKGGHLFADRVAWLLGNLKPGEERSVTLTWKAKAAGKICLDFLAIADSDLKASAIRCTVFTAAPGLGLKMVATKNVVDVGKETSFTIDVFSQGSLPAANVVIKAYVPKELKFVKATGPVEFQKLPGPDDGQIIQFAPVQSLAPMTVANYEVFVEAVKAGDVRFKVELTADHLKAGGPVSETEMVKVLPPDEVKFVPPMLKGTVEPAPK